MDFDIQFIQIMVIVVFVLQKNSTHAIFRYKYCSFFLRVTKCWMYEGWGTS